MGVLYEHWRTDTNECFYVGISWANENTRPHDLTPRNPHHGNIVAKLKENNFEVDVRIQAWDLNKEELCELEVMQIAYWRDLIGNRLTNIAQGGEGLRQWTDEMKEKLSAKKIKMLNDPILGASIRKKLSEARKSYFYDPNFGKERRESAKLRLKKTSTEYWSNEDLKEQRKLLHSKKIKEYWNDELCGEKRKKVVSERFSGDKNPSKNPEIKLKKELTRKSKGSDFYKLSEKAKKQIGLKNKQHMLNKGDLIHTKNLDVRNKNSKTRKIQWSSPEFRSKMMYYWWWSKNVKNYFYWGA